MRKAQDGIGSLIFANAKSPLYIDACDGCLKKRYLVKKKNNKDLQKEEKRNETESCINLHTDGKKFSKF